MELSAKLTQKELYRGLVYLLIELFALPAAMKILNSALPHPLSTARLNFIFFCINFLAVVLLLRKFLCKNIQDAAEILPKCLITATMGVLFYFAANYAVSSLIRFFHPAFANVNDANVAAMLEEDFVLMAIGTVLLVPATEELLFRGVIFRGLYDRSPVLAYAVSTVSFALIHILGFTGTADALTLFLCFVQYLPAGMILCRCYDRSGTIVTPILTHTVVNLVGILVLR